MKTKFTSIITLVVVCLFIFSQCKEEAAEPTPDTRTKQELIKLSKWVISSSISATPVDTDGKDGASTDLLSQLLACQKDETFMFNADSTVTVVNSVKCQTNEKGTWKESWILSPDNKTLTWDGIAYTVKALDANNMILNYSFKKGTETYDITDTYSH